MKLKTLHRTIIALLIIINGVLLYLWIKAPHRPNPEGPKKEIIARLKLDQKQTEAYELLIAEHRKQIRNCDQQMREAKQTYFAALKQEQPKADALALNRMMILDKKINEIHFRHFKALKGLLRKDQVPAFNKLMEEIARMLAPKGPPRR